MVLVLCLVFFVFTAGEPHPADKQCKFINFEDDGYKVFPHIGLLGNRVSEKTKANISFLMFWFR